jgi:hypothetical protein
MRPWRKRFKHGHKRNYNKKWRDKCKQGIRFNPLDETKHHRKPRRLGGSNNGNNISYVLRFKHEAWHALFDSLGAPEIFDKFVRYWDSFGESIASLGHVFGRINKKKSAWIILFGDLNEHQIVSEINDVWLDPTYRITAKFPNLSNAKLVRVRDGKVIRDTAVRTTSNSQTFEIRVRIQSVA